VAVSGISVCTCMFSELPVHESLATVAMSLASCVSLCMLNIGEANDVMRPRTGLLWKYATDQGFHAQWHAEFFTKCVKLLALGVSMLFSKAVFFYRPQCHQTGASENPGTWYILDLACFIGALGYMMTITCSQLYISSALKAGVSQFCHKFYAHRDVEEGISEWNIVQTILRQGAGSIDSCLCVLFTVLLAQFLFTAVWTLQRGDEMKLLYSNTTCCALWVGWMAPLWLWLLYIAYQAAEVTAQCARVPALINSWINTEKDLLLVEYIMNSSAGFYIQGVRVTPYMAMKASYFIGAITFTIITKTVL